MSGGCPWTFATTEELGVATYETLNPKSVVALALPPRPTRKLQHYIAVEVALLRQK